MSARPKPIHRNLAVVVGAVARTPEVRALPDGSTVTELDVRVRAEGAPTSTVPVSMPGDAGALEEGTEVVVVGAVRRRFYRAGGSTVSRTDVLAARVVPLVPVKQANAALAAAAALLGG